MIARPGLRGPPQTDTVRGAEVFFFVDVGEQRPVVARVDRDLARFAGGVEVIADDLHFATGGAEFVRMDPLDALPEAADHRHVGGFLRVDAKPDRDRAAPAFFDRQPRHRDEFAVRAELLDARVAGSFGQPNFCTLDSMSACSRRGSARYTWPAGSTASWLPRSWYSFWASRTSRAPRSRSPPAIGRSRRRRSRRRRRRRPGGHVCFGRFVDRLAELVESAGRRP